MARILAPLSRLRFDKIGCLGDEGNVGPLLYDLPNKVLGVSGPFSTTLDYLISFLQGDVQQSAAYSEAKQVESYISTYLLRLTHYFPTLSPYSPRPRLAKYTAKPGWSHWHYGSSDYFGTHRLGRRPDRIPVLFLRIPNVHPGYGRLYGLVRRQQNPQSTLSANAL